MDHSNLRSDEQAAAEKARNTALFQVQGNYPSTKSEGICRVVYENVNGLQPRIHNNPKLMKLCDIIDELEADIVGMCEHRINFAHKKVVNGPRQLFQREAHLVTIAGYNKNENVAQIQEGGTLMLATDEITQFHRASDSNHDPTGLGRWVSMLFAGQHGKATRVITAYNPCRNSKQDSGTTYQQHRRYLVRHHQSLECPRKRFLDDLTHQLAIWRAAGESIILCMDANQDVYTGPLGRALTDPEGADLLEAVQAATGEAIGPTFFRGSRPIDAVWVSKDLHITNAAVLPVGFGVGDHRVFVLDITTHSFIGAEPPPIQRRQHRRLTTHNPRTVERYNNTLTSLLTSHRCLERLHHLYQLGQIAGGSDVQHQLNQLDMEVTDYMRHAERHCRKIKNGVIPYSPEAAIWIRRRQIYSKLLVRKEQGGGNRGNLIRAAWRCGIDNPLQLSSDEILQRLEICNDQCRYFRLHGPQHRSAHLTSRLEIARANCNEEAVLRIQDIVTRERQGQRFAAIRRVVGTAQGRSVASVQVNRGGIPVEVTTEDEVTAVIISEVHNKRYVMASGAPICQVPLAQEFGHMSEGPAAVLVLDGTYDYSGVDRATADILQEIRQTRVRIPADSISTIVGRQDWQHYWQKADERTSSSRSGLHFGHYKAGCASTYTSHFHAAKATVALTLGTPYNRWKQGVTVMLEKERGVNLVSKLRAILLMEADFNAANKIMFSNRMMSMVRQHNMMPEEIFSEKGKTAVDGTLAKVLFYDLSRQFRKPAAIASVDASNCFDRICHAIASLVFRSSGVCPSASQAMLGTIAEMRFFLRTAFGDSKTFAGGGVEYKTQGMCQGNGAAPAAWGVVSITIINAHKRRHRGATFICPISLLQIDTAGILFVDDTDLMHMDMSNQPSDVNTVHGEMAGAIHNWGHLLLATGGALKPEKCSYTLIGYRDKGGGQWTYNDYSGDENYCMEVPTEDGHLCPISHTSVSVAQKTLGIWTSPDGSSKAQLDHMRSKAQEWVDRLSLGPLPRHLIWLSINSQFWPRVGYGIGCCTASFNELTEALRKPYFKLLSLCGVNRNIRADFRQLPAGFYGIGLPHPGIEATVAALNLFLQHYGSPTLLGRQLQASYEAFALELGLSNTPFQESFGKYSGHCTSSWVRSLWERCWLFQIRLVVNNTALSPPRERDMFFMAALPRHSFTPGELLAINRIRIHQQVLYLSDILDANGKNVDGRYRHIRDPSSQWSNFLWPKVFLDRKDLAIWRQVLDTIAPLQRIQDRLGKWTAPTHKRWTWTMDDNTNQLYHDTGEGIDRYSLPPGDQPQHRWYHYTLSERNATLPPFPHLAQVRWASPTSVRLMHVEAPHRPPAQNHTDFRAVLADWGGTWMWEHTTLVGQPSWIAMAIRNNTLMAATDGSYMRHLAQDSCAAAFVLECSRGSGKFTGVFAVSGKASNAYRGELLGLLAVHLVLQSVQETSPNLRGSAEVYCDCLGAINKVTLLRQQRIPTRTKHSDILKLVAAAKAALEIDIKYSHGAGRQDSLLDYYTRPRSAQLNCECDYAAKQHLLLHLSNPRDSLLPKEATAIIINDTKVAPDSADTVRFHIGRQLARQAFYAKNILTPRQFDKVDWDHVSPTLTQLPKMFQIWVAKHVMGAAGTMAYLHHQTGESPLCPSCQQERETAQHITHCQEAGRQAALSASIQSLAVWMASEHTDPLVHTAVIAFLESRGTRQWSEITAAYPRRYLALSAAQDELGWDSLVTGMVSKEFRSLQAEHLAVSSSRMSLRQWMTQFITQLLQITHGQWLYRNEVVHNATSGTRRNAKKQRLQERIDAELQRGLEHLRPEDYHLMLAPLGDLSCARGEQHEYWLLAVDTARRIGQMQVHPTTGIG